MKQGDNDSTKPATRGQTAEALAADFLARRGLSILERNFRVRGGEIDLICRHGKTLVFVEVRLRSRSDFGSAAESITAPKRQRLILAARHYLLRAPQADCRFDAILLDRLDPAAIVWLENAFSADD